jgi:VIT1/CCC1 family predicted Fe2+/Mn2+ transporter
MKRRMKKTTLAFVALCIAAPLVQLLEFYGLSHWKDGIVLSLLLIGFLLLLALFGWSVLSVRHHRIRAVVSSLICAYCLWQAFQNGKIIY